MDHKSEINRVETVWMVWHMMYNHTESPLARYWGHLRISQGPNPRLFLQFSSSHLCFYTQGAFQKPGLIIQESMSSWGASVSSGSVPWVNIVLLLTFMLVPWSGTVFCFTSSFIIILAVVVFEAGVILISESRHYDANCNVVKVNWFYFELLLEWIYTH